MDVYEGVARDEHGRVVLYRTTIAGQVIEIGEDGHSFYFAATVNGQEYRIYTDDAYNRYLVGTPGTTWAAMRAAATPRTFEECAHVIHALAFPAN